MGTIYTRKTDDPTAGNVTNNHIPITNAQMNSNLASLVAGKVPDTVGVNKPSIRPTLNLDFTKGVLDPRVTFSRASSATYIGADGLLKTAAAGVPRFDCGNTVVKPNTNLLTMTEQFDASTVWATYSNSVITANQAIAPDGTYTADLITEAATTQPHCIDSSPISFISGTSYTFSLRVKAGSISVVQLVFNSPAFGVNAFANFNVSTGTVGTVGSTATATISADLNGFYKCTLTASATSTTSNLIGFYLNNNALSTRAPSYSGNTANNCYIWGASFVTSDQAALPYQSIGNVAPIVTPLYSTSCNGIFVEEQRTNRALQNRDATQSNWVSTNITPLKNQIGIDGISNSASSLTSTSSNGTCIQTVTLASGARVSSIYVKRLTGTGNIKVTMDGITWSTVDLSNGLWNRVVLAATVTNPAIGVLISTVGDSVAIDYAQIEDGAFATSPSATTTSQATRAADIASMTGTNFSNWYSPTQGSFRSLTTRPDTNTIRYIVYPNTGSLVHYYNASGYASINDGTNSKTTSLLTSYNYHNICTSFGPTFLGISADGASASIGSTYNNAFSAMTSMYIGSNNGANSLNGYIKNITFYPATLPIQQLQSLTA